jgi:hypothetical protein
MEKFLLIIGLPRSGTTILTAMIDSHPEVELFYEPFIHVPNSYKISDPNLFVKTLGSSFKISLNPKTKIFGIKEVVMLNNIKKIDGLLENFSKTIQISLVWIVRNPINTSISLIEKIGGSSSKHVVSMMVNSADRSFKELKSLTQKYRGLTVSYEALVENPEFLMGKIMNFLDLDFQEKQYDEEKLKKIRGDEKVSKNSVLLNRVFNDKRISSNQEYGIKQSSSILFSHEIYEKRIVE